MKHVKITTDMRWSVIATIALAACGGDESTSVSEDVSAGLPQGSEPVDLDPAEFTTEIDNPYLPFAVGSRWVYAETADGEPTRRSSSRSRARRRRSPTASRRVVVRDTVTEDGVPVEVTDDWYAQDSEGNVWYLGEDTAEYENGKVASHAGSFEAGVDGAEAGVIMPANPEVGMTYRQEYYEGEAEDEGKVLSLDEMAQAPAGLLPETLMTRDPIRSSPRSPSTSSSPRAWASFWRSTFPAAPGARSSSRSRLANRRN